MTPVRTSLVFSKLLPLLSGASDLSAALRPREHPKPDAHSPKSSASFLARCGRCVPLPPEGGLPVKPEQPLALRVGAEGT